MTTSSYTSTLKTAPVSPELARRTTGLLPAATFWGTCKKHEGREEGTQELRDSENKASRKRGKEIGGSGLERMKSVVMADISRYLKACGGGCGGSKGNILMLVGARLGPMDGCQNGADLDSATTERTTGDDQQRTGQPLEVLSSLSPEVVPAAANLAIWTQPLTT